MFFVNIISTGLFKLLHKPEAAAAVEKKTTLLERLRRSSAS